MKKFSRTCYYVVATMGKVELQNGEYKVIPMDTLKFEDVKQAQRYASKNMLTVLNLEEKCELRSIDILKYIELSDYEKDVEKEEE